MSERDLTQHFGTRVSLPVMMPKVDTLKECREGLTRKILEERFPDRRKLLKEIRKEIDFLIENL